MRTPMRADAKARDAAAALLLDSEESCGPSLVGVAAALALAKQLARLAPPPRLRLISRAVQVAAPLAPTASAAAHGGEWGFARVVRLEQPAMLAVSVDADSSPHGSEPAAARTVRLIGAEAEPQLVWAGRRSGAARLRRGAARRPVGSVPPLLHCGAAFCVTGGLGGLGLRAAALLRERGASHVVLSSRSGEVAREGQGLAERLASLRSSGGGVQLLACDVGAR